MWYLTRISHLCTMVWVRKRVPPVPDKWAVVARCWLRRWALTHSDFIGYSVFSLWYPYYHRVAPTTGLSDIETSDSEGWEEWVEEEEEEVENDA